MAKTEQMPALAGIYALDNIGLDKIAPDARGVSVLALNNIGGGQHELLIYGPVGDYFWGDNITAASVVRELAGIDAGSTINVRIDSDGGVVTDGLAIFNALKSHPARVEVTIDGVAASIASLIAQAGDTRRVYKNSTMMIHGPMSGAWGFADDMRNAAEMLDTMAAAMLTSYAERAADPDLIASHLSDRRDHWFTASQMIDAGLADVVIDANSSDAGGLSIKAAAASMLSSVQALAANPRGITAVAIRQKLQATVTAPAFASLCEAHQRAVIGHIEDLEMKQNCELIMAQAGLNPPAQPVAPEPTTTPAVAGAPVAGPIADPLAALAARNETLRSVFAAFADVPGVRDLEIACLADPRMTVEQAQAKLLQRLPNGAEPLSNIGESSTAYGSVTVVRDEKTARIQRIADGILARAGLLSGAEAVAARQGNPAAHQPLHVLAEQSLIAAGINTRDMDRTRIAQRALAQGTSDFTVVLENVLNKMLLAAYRPSAVTWSRFCATGTLTDYRPHARYHMGSFSDLKSVNEDGEYEIGVLSDAAKETITGSRKGRILQITPEVLVNDDLGAFSRPTVALGQAAARAIEKDVYALLALNSGAGPTMSDGVALFHASHGNIPTAAAPDMASVDAGRQLMAAQMDVGANDYLDIVPTVWLGPLSLGSKAREINAAEYNDDANKQQRRPNVVRGLFADVVDSPRLTGTAWYMFADPTQEPVIEVAFLNGVQTPTIEQELNFRTDGVAWKVVHRYGVAAVGWRGAIRNAGA